MQNLEGHRRRLRPMRVRVPSFFNFLPPVISSFLRTSSFLLPPSPQELAVEVFIPNDVFLVGKGGESSDRQQQEGRGKSEKEKANEEGEEGEQQQQERRQKRRPEGGRGLAVVTGPNFSGKSVYIKTVGVLTYLAHLGCFLPCQQALIGLVDGIYTRIASAETVTVQQSTFTIDCR